MNTYYLINPLKALLLLNATLFLSACATTSSEKKQSQSSSRLLSDVLNEQISQKSSADEVINNLGNMIDPQKGMFLVLREGNTEVLKYVNSKEQLSQRLRNHKNLFQNINCKFENADELPEFNEAGEFTKKGCFAVPYTTPLIVEKMKLLQNQLDMEFTKEEIRASLAIDTSITHAVVITDAFMELLFSEKGSDWHLVCINLATYDASL
ncbi:MAG: hypothetical protein NZM38_04045 [Cytophagales bacterium]|nr:hypothetical protein [Cytophagales bacterium]MDW8383922.1 hypothetical protein [Flammeovirgaceae bacterium]